MHELLLLRHAKSSWSEPTKTDHERPLNARGRAAAPLMGRLLRDLDLLPDLILSSDSTRTRETVHLLTEAAGIECDPIFLSSLYHTTPATILACVDEHPDANRILVVAHNPGLQELVSAFAGVITGFPTAALAHFEFDGDNVTLRGLWRPKELDS